MYPFLNYTISVYFLCRNCIQRWLFWWNDGLVKANSGHVSRSRSFFLQDTNVAEFLSQWNVFKHHLDRYKNSAISSVVNTCCRKWMSQLCGLAKDSVQKPPYTVNTRDDFQCTASTLLSEVNRAVALVLLIITESIHWALSLYRVAKPIHGLCHLIPHPGHMR